MQVDKRREKKEMIEKIVADTRLDSNECHLFSETYMMIFNKLLLLPRNKFLLCVVKLLDDF
jgi:hypothetical protein